MTRYNFRGFRPISNSRSVVDVGLSWWHNDDISYHLAVYSTQVVGLSSQTETSSRSFHAHFPHTLAPAIHLLLPYHTVSTRSDHRLCHAFLWLFGPNNLEQTIHRLKCLLEQLCSDILLSDSKSGFKSRLKTFRYNNYFISLNGSPSSTSAAMNIVLYKMDYYTITVIIITLCHKLRKIYNRTHNCRYRKLWLWMNNYQKNHNLYQKSSKANQ